MSKLTPLTNFSAVPNKVLQDPELSAAAKGVFAYLQSKPPGWRFSYKRIAEEMRECGDTVRKLLIELEEIGYLERKPINESGRRSGYDYQLYSRRKPVKQQSCTRIGKSEPRRFRYGNNKKDINKKYTDISKDISGQAPAGGGEPAGKQKPKKKQDPEHNLIVEVIREFTNVDPKNKEYYGNTTQRNAAKYLINQYGYEEVLQRVRALPKTNEMPYFPVILSPWQLKNKWKALEVAVTRYRRDTQKQKQKRQIII